MKFRWKLLVLLLGISSVPVVSLRTFGIHNVHLMSDALVAEVQKRRIDEANHRLQLATKDFSKNIGTIRKQVEMALFYQLFELRRILGKELSQSSQNDRPQSSDHRDRVADETLFPLSAVFDKTAEQQPNANPVRQELCFSTPPSVVAEDAKTYAVRLNRLSPVYQAVSEYLGGLVLRQYFGLENGLYCAYPCEGEGPLRAKAEEQPWYLSAMEDTSSIWSRPYTDPVSGLAVMAVSLPIEREDDSTVGVASMLVPLSSLLEKAYFDSELPASTRAYLFTLAFEPSKDIVGAKVIASAGHSNAAEGERNAAEKREWLLSSDTAAFDSMLKDIARHQYRIREMPFEGKSSYWAYGPLLHQGSAFAFIVPRDELLSADHPVLEFIRERVGKVELYTAGFLVFLVLASAALAIAFSKTVTRPLETLSNAARTLAQGDFDSRVAIASKDEFGDMGRVFNSVGPQLKKHYKTQQYLEVAMEIQQNLLPESAPTLPGLEMHGMTLFSDETGGDYFDYLCIDRQGRSKLCVAVGDVSDHGIPSALLMATARALLRMRSDSRDSLDDIVADVNREFSKDVGDSGRFMTLFLARIDRDHNRMEWVRAGHDPAILYDPTDDSFKNLDGGKGLPIGVFENAVYEVRSCEIRPGQIVYLGTDGIWEARNSEGETFGKERLQDVIRKNAEFPARKIVHSILDEVGVFCGTAEQEDDLTPVIVKIL